MAYVYGHYKADTDELFYIGKGTDKRAWSRKGRSLHWKRTVTKHGYKVRILEDGLTDEQAFLREKELISEVGISNLVNVTDGGDGYTSEAAQRRSQDPEYRRKNAEVGKRNSQNKERSKKISDAMKAIFSDEAIKQKVSDGLKDRYQDPEFKRRLSEVHTKRLQSEEWKLKQRKWCDDPEFKRKQSERRKQWWAAKKQNDLLNTKHN